MKVKLNDAGVFCNTYRGESYAKQITLIAMPKISLLCAFQSFSCGYARNNCEVLFSIVVRKLYSQRCEITSVKKTVSPG